MADLVWPKGHDQFVPMVNTPLMSTANNNYAIVWHIVNDLKSIK